MEQFIFSDADLLQSTDGRKRLVLGGDEHFHLSRVLRIKPGEKVLATNGQGRTLSCVVSEIGRDETACEVIDEYVDFNLPRREFCIAMALLKPMSKLELAIEKCTELGARRFVLFTSERCESSNPRLERLDKIVRSAVKQSLRSRIPEIKFVGGLEHAATEGKMYDDKFVLHEKSSDMITDRIFNSNQDKLAIALIGPEGGFSENEIGFLKQNGYGCFSLGSARLRAETAAISVASILSIC